MWPIYVDVATALHTARRSQSTSRVSAFYRMIGDVAAIVGLQQA